MPERASARSADWAPGPGVLVPLPADRRGNCQRFHLWSLCTILENEFWWSWWCMHTARSTDLDVQRRDAQLLALGRHVLSGQHGGIWGGFVAVGFDFHAGDGCKLVR